MQRLVCSSDPRESGSLPACSYATIPHSFPPSARGNLWPSYMLTVTQSKCTHFWMVSGVAHLCSAARAPLHLAVPVVTESVASYPPPLAGIAHCGTQWRTCTTTITYAAERVHEMPPSFLSLFQSVGFTVAMQWMRMILYSHFGASFHVWVSFMTMKTAASCPELLVYQWLLFLLLIFCCFCIFLLFFLLSAYALKRLNYQIFCSRECGIHKEADNVHPNTTPVCEACLVILCWVATVKYSCQFFVAVFCY